MSVNLTNSNDITIQQADNDISLNLSSTINQKLTSIPNVYDNYTEALNDTYSCSYINELSTYSTQEHMIGSLGDKPLYSKTYTFTVNHTGGNSTVETNYAHGISNIDTIFIDQAHSFAISGNNSYILGRSYINNGAVAFSMSAIANSTSIRTEIFYNGSLTFNFTITLNYTKTTD